MSTFSYIANLGIITSIGNNLEDHLQAISNGKSGISLPEYLVTKHQLPVGEIKYSNQSLAEMAQCSASLPRTALLSILAAQQAWLPIASKTAGLRIGFISANTVGGMDLTDRFYAAFKKDPNSGNVDDVKYHECGAITHLTTKQLQLNCWQTTISTACSSSANSIMMASRLLAQNKFDIVIAGGADSLSRFTLNGFNALMILDKEPCKPFDANRKGLNLGEGAAYLVLANEKAINQLSIKPVAAITGYANTNDAHHQTASSPEGIGNHLAMKEALQQASIKPEAIDYINLHGTGTENNDSSEGIAIQTIFGDSIPPASSTKAFTGHTLGAAGAVEAALSFLSIKEQILLPHLRWQTQMEQLSWQPQTKLQTASIKHILSNSFGFGGNCSSLVISKVQ